MHPTEINEVLDSMVCICDSREQSTPKLKARLKQINLPVEREALLCGDYSAKVKLPSGEWYQIPVSLERKMNISEACMCYCQERSRFVREFDRAKDNNIKMYLLIEDATWENIYAGRYRSKMLPQSLVASLLSWLARYNCQIIMCKAETTGRIIHDILYREAKEILMGMVDE